MSILLGSLCHSWLRKRWLDGRSNDGSFSGGKEVLKVLEVFEIFGLWVGHNQLFADLPRSLTQSL